MFCMFLIKNKLTVKLLIIFFFQFFSFLVWNQLDNIPNWGYE